MRYLFGDSSESDLEFDYLAFLREVIDCAVVMAECEVTLAVTVEDRRTREAETASVVAAVEELGRRASQLVGAAATDQPATPVGRCAAAIATAIDDAVERESGQARAALAVECEEMDRQDQRQRARAKGVLEKLLRTHDLPGAETSLEVVWTAAGVKATMRQRTGFGVDAVLALDIPASSALGIDLRVDKLVENVEIHAHETAGWLKKSEKVVPLKLGRYQVVGVTVDRDATTVRLRAAPEANAAGFVITARRSGDLSVEPSGGAPGREVAIEDRSRPGLRLLAERLETALRALADNRAGLVSVEIDGVPIAQHGHPRVFAERLIAAVAPTVQKIAQRSRSPGELVLRRPIGDNRREEIFVSTADLWKRLDGLPLHAREVFAPLQLGPEPASAPAEPRPGADARPTPRPPAEVKHVPVERTASPLDRRFDTESETRPDARPEARPDARPEARPDARPELRPDTRPDPRHLHGRAVPPPAPMPERRSGPSRLVPDVLAHEPRRTAPAHPRAEPPVVDLPIFEDQSPPFPTPARAVDKPPEIATETGRKRADDTALGDAIDRALEDGDGTPPR